MLDLLAPLTYFVSIYVLLFLFSVKTNDSAPALHSPDPREGMKTEQPFLI